MKNMIFRKILPYSRDFKSFWKDTGPFRYALSSKEFPPVLLEPEEWIFGNELVDILKELMQFNQRKMKFVKAPFNKDNKEILRPDEISFWKINNFCQEWERIECEIFTPVGYITKQVVNDNGSLSADQVEQAFFSAIETSLDSMGYIFFKPKSEKSKWASVQEYLREWEEDDKDSGFL